MLFTHPDPINLDFDLDPGGGNDPDPFPQHRPGFHKTILGRKVGRGKINI